MCKNLSAFAEYALKIDVRGAAETQTSVAGNIRVESARSTNFFFFRINQNKAASRISAKICMQGIM
jgi:hypothetical protein